MFLRALSVSLLSGWLALAVGCVQLGSPDYSGQDLPPKDGVSDPLRLNPFPPVPPDPFQEGDERLSVGYFYEGGRSQTIPINTVTQNYFIFAIDPEEPVATLTYSQTTSYDRVEGLQSLEITLNDWPFWGGGIVWDDPIDLSEWTTMYVAFKSSDASFERFNISLQSGPGEMPAGVDLDPRNYGYQNDGEWHFLRIPLQDAIDLGWDPSQARSPFIIGAPTERTADVMLIDNLYFTKE